MRRLLLVLLVAGPAQAAQFGLPGRSTMQGLIPLPDVARCFMPQELAGFAPMAQHHRIVVPEIKLLPTFSANPRTPLPAASAAGVPQGKMKAADTKTGLENLAAGSAKNNNAPLAGAMAFDGAGARKRRDDDPGVPAGQPQPALPAGSLPLPIVRQATDYSCGAAALLSILFYWQVYDGGESELYGDLGTTPADGTAPWKLAEVAAAHGLKAEMRERQTLDDLRAGLNRGETVIVDFQAWKDEPGDKPWKDTWDDGHYSVVAGIDDHYIYLMDPSGGPGYTYIPLAEFLERWHDFETTPAGRLESHQLAIYIKGDKPLTAFPGPLIRGQ